MPPNQPPTRRVFLRGGAMTGLLIAARPSRALAETEKEEIPVSPPEDLMREHGVLNRLLLVYNESARRLRAGGEYAPEALKDAVSIIRSFIEDYHEKLEEQHLFPRFEKAGKLVELVHVLRTQHDAGRKVTDRIQRLLKESPKPDADQRKELASLLRSYIRMYLPHESREDTVLFPALRMIVTPNEYAALGEDFEDKEHELFGDDGFQAVVDRVAGIEKRVGIHDLAQFTPR
jgi:hemerythrin-like domain-containing protein